MICDHDLYKWVWRQENSDQMICGIHIHVCWNIRILVWNGACKMAIWVWEGVGILVGHPTGRSANYYNQVNHSSIHPSVCLSVCLSIPPSICLSVHPSVHPPSIHLSIYLSIRSPFQPPSHLDSQPVVCLLLSPYWIIEKIRFHKQKDSDLNNICLWNTAQPLSFILVFILVFSFSFILVLYPMHDKFSGTKPDHE